MFPDDDFLRGGGVSRTLCPSLSRLLTVKGTLYYPSALEETGRQESEKTLSLGRKLLSQSAIALGMPH